jgi:nicotinamide-nucleotide adenylyltransferase
VPKYNIVFSNDDFTLSLYQKRGIEVIPVPLLQREMVSGTNIRKMITTGKDWHDLVPQGTKNVLLRIKAKQRLSKIL